MSERPEPRVRTCYDLDDGRLVYEPSFFETDEADRLLREIRDALPWEPDRVRMFGRVQRAPRLTAYVGDPGCAYAYAGVTREPLAWVPALTEVRKRLDAHLPHVPWNAVLVNRYRNGHDSMGWHSDDEPELGPAPWVASVSFGAPRTFRLRQRDARRLPPVAIDLAHGSLILMEPPTQAHWQHCLPPRTRVGDERINLTFRAVEPR